jgi:hypothetical protein
MKKYYGNLIIMTPRFLTSGKEDSFNLKLIPRDNHKYLLGKEILIAAYLLSKCKILLYAGSNVTAFASFLNQNQYDMNMLINNGVNSNNPYLAKIMFGIRKLLPSSIDGLKNEIIIEKKMEIARGEK